MRQVERTCNLRQAVYKKRQMTGSIRLQRRHAAVPSPLALENTQEIGTPYQLGYGKQSLQHARFFDTLLLIRCDLHLVVSPTAHTPLAALLHTGSSCKLPRKCSRINCRRPRHPKPRCSILLRVDGHRLLIVRHPVFRVRGLGHLLPALLRVPSAVPQ